MHNKWRVLIRNIFIGGSVYLQADRFTAKLESGEFEDGDYAACRFSHPQLGQSSKKLGITSGQFTHLVPSISLVSTSNLFPVSALKPQCGQGSPTSDKQIRFRQF